MELLSPGLGLIFWTTLVFILLVILLKRVAWSPILGALQEREKSIQEALDSAEKAKQDMTALKADNEKLLQEARNERDEILRLARNAANRLREEAHAEAQKTADKIIIDAKAFIDSEKQKAVREVKNEAIALSIQVAAKILKKNLDSDSAQRELAETYIKEIKVN